MLGVLVAALLGACAPRAERAVESPRQSERARGGKLTAHFIDVGQGDASLFLTDDRRAMLVDAGPPGAEAKMTEVLQKAREYKLEAVVLTHPHADHYGAMSRLFRATAITRFFEGDGADTGAYATLMNALGQRSVSVERVRRGRRWSLGAFVDVDTLAPKEPLIVGSRSDANANSVVLRVVHHAPRADVRVLLTGDAEEPTEERLLQEPPSLQADVLKVAHHGSRFSNSAKFLAAVAPKVAVISCGVGNRYGHPHEEAVQRLQAQGARIYRTDTDGDVFIDSGVHGWTPRTERTDGPVARIH